MPRQLALARLRRGPAGAYGPCAARAAAGPEGATAADPSPACSSCWMRHSSGSGSSRRSLAVAAHDAHRLAPVRQRRDGAQPRGPRWWPASWQAVGRAASRESRVAVRMLRKKLARSASTIVAARAPVQPCERASRDPAAGCLIRMTNTGCPLSYDFSSKLTTLSKQASCGASEAALRFPRRALPRTASGPRAGCPRPCGCWSAASAPARPRRGSAPSI